MRFEVSTLTDSFLKEESIMQRPITKQQNIINLLDKELSRLKDKFQMAHELKVEWLPNPNSNKSGEVLGKTIYIYEEDEAKAVQTLRHEFLDYILSSELIAPYQKLINKLISLFEEEMHDRKEKLI